MSIGFIYPFAYLMGMCYHTLGQEKKTVAIGHPVGATGARILMTLIYELRRRGGGLGLATICGAGAHGYAMIVEITS